MIYKGFFHGRGQHSKGWDGYVLCGTVNSEEDKFDAKTYSQYSGLVNYPVSLKAEPKDIDKMVVDYVVKHKEIVETIFEKPVDPVITKLIDLGLVKADTTAKTVDDLKSDDKAITAVK